MSYVGSKVTRLGSDRTTSKKGKGVMCSKVKIEKDGVIHTLRSVTLRYLSHEIRSASQISM